MFDYEWATVQHNVNCRLAQASSCPTRSRPSGCTRYGARRQAAALPRAQGGVLPRRLRARSGGARRAGARSRPAARRRAHAARRSRSTTASRTTSSPRSSSDCAARRPSCCPASPSSAPQLDGFIVPERAIDAQSLIAYADLVVSAGRHDEPRGRRARHAGVDDVRGPHGRRRRASDRRGPAAPAAERGPRSSCASASVPPARACAAIRACLPICCASPWAPDIRAQPRAPIRRSFRGQRGFMREPSIPRSPSLPT